LKRSLYRGEVIYGKAKKRDVEGHVRPKHRPPSEWVRTAAPALGLVPPDITEAVDARFESQRTRAMRLHDGRLLGRVNDKYRVVFRWADGTAEEEWCGDYHD
jgi:hypothetical protein